jgi:hypothetical protein
MVYLGQERKGKQMTTHKAFDVFNLVNTKTGAIVDRGTREQMKETQEYHKDRGILAIRRVVRSFRHK